MKEYDVIAIGTGSAMSLISAMIKRNPSLKAAVIDKDDPGGICLTRGCIPSKLLLYPAEVVRTIEEAQKFGIEVDVKDIDFSKVMERMRTLIDNDINMIRDGLSNSKNIDYYPLAAEFVAPYTLRVGDEKIKSSMILLCTGSKPKIPKINGLEQAGYHTSDSILRISTRPRSIIIVGGGYIAAEYGHFFAAMGSKVTIIGRNPQFLPKEESEISALAKRELEKRDQLSIHTNNEVREVEKTQEGRKVIAVNRVDEKKLIITADEILIAAGRSPNTDILHPEKAGIETNKQGWILVNEYLETSQPNIWALGDANGQYQFKHAANYETRVVYYNAVLKKRLKVDYHAVPHAVFTDPEIAGVGLRENEVIDRLGKDNVLIGFQRYEDTAKGEAMAAKDYFAKVILEKETMRILGAHIIGPQASILIQEIINLMYTTDERATPIFNGMHIHPALSEVVERAFGNLMAPDHYHHNLEHLYEFLQHPHEGGE